MSLELYKQAFGQDFNLGIEVPEQFEDISWKNDACPSFSLKPVGDVVIILWVDYEDPESRECGGTRYAVHRYINDDFNECLFETESPEAIIKYLKSEGL